MALTASVGTITDDGDGVHWTWSSTPAPSGLVYVTATDPDGLTGQAVFQLKINAAAGPDGARSADRRRTTDRVDLRHQRDRSRWRSDHARRRQRIARIADLTDHGNGTGTVSGNAHGRSGGLRGHVLGQ